MICEELICAETYFRTAETKDAVFHLCQTLQDRSKFDLILSPRAFEGLSEVKREKSPAFLFDLIEEIGSP